MVDTKKFGERLHALLERDSLKKGELAQQLKFGKNNVKRWEDGEVEPNQSTLNLLATFFGVSPEYLSGNTDDPYDGIEKEPVTEFGDGFSKEELALIELFRQVPQGRKESALILLKALADN